MKHFRSIHLKYLFAILVIVWAIALFELCDFECTRQRS